MSSSWVEAAEEDQEPGAVVEVLVVSSMALA